MFMKTTTVDRILHKRLDSAVEMPKEELASWMYSNTDTLEIKPSVKSYLLAVAEKVRRNIPIKDMVWRDIWIVGSSLGYNYTDTSDIDLHIVVDLDEMAEKHKLSLDELRDLLGYMFKELKLRDLYQIDGHPVELYWQNSSEQLYTPAAYSLVQDKFVKKPVREAVDDLSLDQAKKAAKNAYQRLLSLISEGSKTGVEEWKRVLKETRRSGLEKDGLYSYGNLLYKYLRDWGAVVKASDFIDQI